MTGPPRRFLSRDGWSVAYRRSGDGPPLLLLHATQSSSTQLQPLADQFAARFTVIAVDRRGSGESRPPAALQPGPIDVAVHVDDLVAILAAERIGSVLVVGYSYGGCLALELAARRPGLVVGGRVHEPPYGPAGSPSVGLALADVGRRTAAAVRRGGPGAAAEVFLDAVAGPSALADASLLGLEPSGLARIRCPVTLTGGTLSPPFYAEILNGLVTRIPGASIVRIAGVGHGAPISHPGIIAAAVEAFAVRSGWAAGPTLRSGS